MNTTEGSRVLFWNVAVRRNTVLYCVTASVTTHLTLTNLTAADSFQLLGVGEWPGQDQMHKIPGVLASLFSVDASNWLRQM